MRQGESEKLLIKGTKTRRPAEFKVFLSNSENKTQLFQLMLKSWTSKTAAPLLKDRLVILIVEGTAHKLTSADGTNVERNEVLSMRSSQEEYDTRFIIYTKWAQDNGYKAVCIRSSDADVFFILLNYTFSFNIAIDMDMGTKNNKKTNQYI